MVVNYFITPQNIYNNMKFLIIFTKYCTSEPYQTSTYYLFLIFYSNAACTAVCYNQSARVLDVSSSARTSRPYISATRNTSVSVYAMGKRFTAMWLASYLPYMPRQLLPVSRPYAPCTISLVTLDLSSNQQSHNSITINRFCFSNGNSSQANEIIKRFVGVLTQTRSIIIL